MARMIPPVIGTETVSPGEKQLFERFRNEPGTDGWVIFHSLDVPRHQRQVMGEIDFVIAVPGYGVLCLEVKSHLTVRRDLNGIWHLGQDAPNHVGPFRQASEGMQSLREFVSERSTNLRKTMFWSAVCFTHVAVSLKYPAEWHDWQKIDLSDLRAHSLAHLVRGVLSHARVLVASKPTATWFDPTCPTSEDIDELVELLRPSFEFFESPRSRRQQREQELRSYTAEQYVALEAMDPSTNPRVVFEGPAGTGKTVLALEEARRSISRGQRVLLCCYNSLLGNWLRNEASPLGPAVTAGTFHSYMRSLSGRSTPSVASNTFWEEELPDAALEKCLEVDFQPFDVLIIDEAQDLLLSNYLDVLDHSVSGGLAGGKWRMFGDFERQAIYGTASLPLEDVLTKYSPGVPRYRLTKNCRNTPRIASLVKLLAAFDRGYAEVLRPDNFVEPQTLYFQSEQDQQDKLIDLLETLHADGFSSNEIVILSPRSNESLAKRITDPAWKHRLKPASADGSGGIRYCTVHAFKGLEAPVVIVTDINSIGSEADRSLFYVALTRATERLYVLMSAQLKAAVLKILTDQNKDGGSL